MSDNRIVVGIDLGTTNTLACYFRKGKPNFIKFAGSKMLPSVLYVDPVGTLYVGKIASAKGILDPKNEIRSSKTHMGDFSKEWNCNGRTFNATQAATEILKEVKRCIIKKMKCSEDTPIDAVITVPAYFNSNQTDETRKAGQEAGLNVTRIITEPMAAAIAAVTENELDKKIFVVDLGGGTFDLSVLEADQSTHSYYALDISGDRKLGGDDFDNAIKNYLVKIIEDDLGMDLSSYQSANLSEGKYNSSMGRIRNAAALAKEELSTVHETDINIDNLFEYDGKAYDLNITISRDKFERECAPLFEKIANRIRKFIAESDRFKLSDISTVVLAGGSCYIPKVQQIVKEILNKPINVQSEFSTLVAKGACLYADSGSSGIAIKIEDVLSHSLGISSYNGYKGDGTDKLVLAKILNKGDKYPCSNTRSFWTIKDFQKAMDIDVYEAGSDCENIEDIEAHDFYGGFTLEDITPAPAGQTHVQVTFSYDKSRCLIVTAREEESGAEKRIEIRKH